MGNDGGSIPRRRDLVKNKKPEKIINKQLLRFARAKLCSYTKLPLAKPIVFDKIGNLYNKETLLRAMLDKTLPSPYRHITSLKDIKEANISMRDHPDEDKALQIYCPIANIEYSGQYNFIGIWKCGCIMSEKAFKELTVHQSKCPICSTSFDLSSDIICLNISQEIQEKMKQTLIMSKKHKSNKKEAPIVIGKRERPDVVYKTMDDLAEEIINIKKTKLDGTVIVDKKDEYKDDFLSRPSHFGIR